MNQRIDTPHNRRFVLLLVADMLLINASLLVSLFLFQSGQDSLLIYLRRTPLFVVLLLILYSLSYCLVFRLDRVIWRYCAPEDLERNMLAVTASYVIAFALSLIPALGGFLRLPGPAVAVALILSAGTVLALRLYRRVYCGHKKAVADTSLVGNIMVIGAGNAGYLVTKELADQPGCRVVCLIDRDERKIHCNLLGVPVAGDRTTIPENVKKYAVDRIVFAIPSCPADDRAEILSICARTGCDVRVLPGILEFGSGDITLKDARSVRVEDLLGREPIRADLAFLRTFLEGRTVLVTGGGGSIGSELCRQIASFSPAHLVIFDIYENNAYDIQNELKSQYPDLALDVIIGSVRDEKRVNDVFETYRPDLVFHAAAHKHVPLMEDSPCEAVKNNVFGTLNVVRAADRFGCRRFVMISSDKAVNPTNVMGATKRICEMIVQAYNNHSETEYVSVRFGNVLGSSGSVVPLFEKQIMAGGPVTVTHPDIIRYFMTIPEAVSLVLQAGAFAGGGEIFVLDMGKPVRILDLAENLIRLSGREPYRDIEIRFTGLRPGEKLYEELLMSEEGMKRTDNKMIYIGKPIEFDEKALEDGIEALRETVETDGAAIRERIRSIVNTYTYTGAVC